MKAGMVFTDDGPILFLITYPSFDDPALIAKLKDKGMDKYLAFEVPVELCRQRYGARFASVIQDIKPKDDMRVLDYNSQHAFYTFKWEEMANPVKVYSRDK